MQVIRAINVNDAYADGLELLRDQGEKQGSRAGPVVVMPCPVTTAYACPQQRVLFDPNRDANPFLHLFEALWMLSGSRDARWLDRFVRDFSSRFAEEGGMQHGAYGYRWRHHFDLEGGGAPGLPDQLDTVVRLLKENPLDRRAVLTMWDPVADLGVSKKDIPCNTHIYPRLRGHGGDYWPDGEPIELPDRVLDLTVCCRSNDAIWGAYGANAVHFSVLQEYLAGRLGARVGTYYQISNNFHAYLDVLEKVGAPAHPLTYPQTRPMGADWSKWDNDLSRFMEWSQSDEPDQAPVSYPNNPWFHETAEPLFIAHMLWKRGERAHALEIVGDDTVWDMAPDWRQAAEGWMKRRMK